jgi:hypothetical protein
MLTCNDPDCPSRVGSGACFLLAPIPDDSEVSAYCEPKDGGSVRDCPYWAPILTENPLLALILGEVLRLRSEVEDINRRARTQARKMPC